MKLESKQYQMLVQERTELLAEQGKLFAGAEAANRGLTDEEKTRDDAIALRMGVVGADLARHERRREMERQAPAAALLPATGDEDLPEELRLLKAEILGHDKARRSHARRSGQADELFAQVPGVRAVSVAGRITGGDERAAAKPYQSFADNLFAAVHFARDHEHSTAYRQYVANVQKLYAASGLNETVGSEGGVLVMTDFVAGLLLPLHQDGPFTTRTRNIPVSSDANGIVINAINETSRATGSRWGGVRGYRLAEAGTLTGSKPDFRKMELKLKKYGVLAYSTDELLKDSAALEAVLTQAAGEELSFMANDDILNGLGVAGALGILNAGALISVPKESGQAAGTVVNANLVKMWQRLHPRNRANAVWFINSEVEPQLDQLSIPAGVAALEPRYVTYGPDGVLRIKGKPVVVNEFNAAAGTLGDIVLADLSDYVTIDKGGVQYATSIHVQFLTDEMVFRFIFRYDGQPALNAPITPYKGTLTQSAYVGLAARA